MSPLTDGLWNSLPNPAFIVRPDDVIAAVNPPAEQFLNFSARQLLDQPIFDCLAIDAPLEDAFERVRASASAVFVNAVDVGTGHAAPTACNLQISPLSGATGHVLVMLEPRHIAERLGQVHSVSSAAKSAIGMAEMLAHEIKNPLAGITGAAQLLSMNLEPQDVELTDLIVSESRRIVALLDQVEHFGNLRPPQRQNVNVHDILDRARKSAALGVAANMQIIEDYDPSLPLTHVDVDQMLQVFLNLINNAAQAAETKGGTIQLRTFYDVALRLRRKDGSGEVLPLQIEVIDDGPGLPADIAGDIFDPFVSGRENGTGLGLALVSKIISDHGGWIAVDSAPGRTLFRVSLPVAHPHVSDP